MSAAVLFKVDCHITRPGDAVFIVGDHEEVGAWNPAQAVPCITTPLVFPKWTSEKITLPLGHKVEFKLMVQRADGRAPEKALWEKGENRVLLIPKTSNATQVQVSVNCAWGYHQVNYRIAGGSASATGSRTSLVASPKASPTLSPQAAPTNSFTRIITPTSCANSSQKHLEVEEFGSPVSTLATGFARMISGPKSGSPTSLIDMSMMMRTGSRHLCIGADGAFDQDLSRTPSMMLLSLDELQESVDARQKDMQILEERDRLNKMQRRMKSGMLLEEMKKITDYADASRTFLLQGFNWESWRAGGGDWYGIVASKLDMLAEMGFTDVWLPPCSASVAPQGYLPSRLFDLDASKYGSQASLESLLTKMHDKGIRGVADIVINHRCGDKQDEQGRWNQFSSGMTKRPSLAGVLDWGGWAVTLGDKFSDGTGLHGPGVLDDKFDAAPDIDHRNKEVQEGISVWLRWLRLQIGFDAWRFDFVKGYAANFVGLYCDKSEPAWAVGELWCDMAYDDQGLCYNQDKHRQDLCNWINSTGKKSGAFDFTTKGILQEACRNTQYWRLRDSKGKPPGLMGWLPQHAVTFIDNHDTGSTQRHWPFPDDKVLVGYAYIITHPGIPCIFWDHVIDWGEDHRRKISELMKARRDAEIPVDAPVNILSADDTLYLAEIGKPPALRVALGPREAVKPDMKYWSDATAGRHYKVWVHKTIDLSAQVVKVPKVTGHAQTDEISPPSFEPVTVDGQRLTPTSLMSMSAHELQSLQNRLQPLLSATKQVLEAAKKRPAGAKESKHKPSRTT